MSLHDYFRTQRKISGIETLAGFGTMAIGAITGNRTVSSIGAGVTALGMATNPDIPMCRWPYHHIKSWCMDFYHYRPRISYFDRYIDRCWGHRMHHPRPMLHHAPMRPGGPHR